MQLLSVWSRFALKKNKEKKIMAIVKLFALHANGIKIEHKIWAFLIDENNGFGIWEVDYDHYLNMQYNMYQKIFKEKVIKDYHKIYMILAVIKQSFRLITHSKTDALSDQSSDFFVTILEIFRVSNWKSLWRSLRKTLPQIYKYFFRKLCFHCFPLEVFINTLQIGRLHIQLLWLH